MKLKQLSRHCSAFRRKSLNLYTLVWTCAKLGHITNRERGSHCRGCVSLLDQDVSGRVVDVFEMVWTQQNPSIPARQPPSAHPGSEVGQQSGVGTVGIAVAHDLQCIPKVFRTLDFFHILLRYSLILKWI